MAVIVDITKVGGSDRIETGSVIQVMVRFHSVVDNTPDDIKGFLRFRSTSESGYDDDDFGVTVNPVNPGGNGSFEIRLFPPAGKEGSFFYGLKVKLWLLEEVLRIFYIHGFRLFMIELLM